MNLILKKSLLIYAAILFHSALLLAYSPPASVHPADLRCEFREDPLGVDVNNPSLSWILTALNTDERGLRQTSYQVLVATSPDLLKNEKGDLWNSGKVMSDQMGQIIYSGKPLQSSQQCWWKVKVWDQHNQVSAWSEPARWTMGILQQADWKAAWLSAKGAEKFALRAFGYHARVSKKENEIKWVQVDLQKPVSIAEIRLHPMNFWGRYGVGFPVRFKIEVSEDSAFVNPVLVQDNSAADFKNPGKEVVSLPLNSITGRYVRITCTKQWSSKPNEFKFILKQLEVITGGKNIAVGKPVKASDSIERWEWAASALTNGGIVGDNDANYSSMLLRHQFQVKPGLQRAIIHASGLAHYELSVNGNKIGEDIMSPGWTNYRKTILYDTYDVTKQLKQGNNAVGMILGNGMYNIQADPVRYVKFLNTFGPLKAIAHLRLEYSDGSVQIIGTDKSWKVSPGPVTYSNVFAGEDYDARLEQQGWDNPSFEINPQWDEALETMGPGGELKGLSCAAAPIKAVETLKPVNVAQLRADVVVYDLGQNASVMPRIAVSGPKGSYVRIIPAELLKPDGTVDRTSATQDGVRPAWWQYTLAGRDKENWFPKFFYQGARYLQVELYPTETDGKLPVVEMLEGVVVHSSSEPVGTFSSSNDLFNRIHKLVRWAQRSNMMSVMTDCPHREKLGWLEENHLNGPSLRYNFNLNALFTKNMNDMVDSQFDNGFVPNIAPEYFIASTEKLTDGFRNSPEWGSAFIIVPWQQYLFSGDISLLKRYYPAMKRYVEFLRSTAKENIIHTGLGDWYDLGPKEPWGSQLTPVPLTATAIYYYDTWILSQTARLLGDPKESEQFRKQALAIKESFNKEFYKPEAGQYATGSQTANSMPVVLDIVEPENRKSVIEAVVKDVRSRGNALTSGDVGYRYLLNALSMEGYSDVIYDMNNQSDKPGYGYQLKMGATSLTEKWNAGVGNFGSQNHFMLGQINEWFFQGLVGIGVEPEGAGFRKSIIKPEIVGDLQWVKGSFRSVSGLISVEWKRENDKLFLYVSIPPNTTAKVYVPAQKPSDIKEGKQVAAKAEGVKFIEMKNGKAVYEVMSGNYHFLISMHI